MKPFLLPRFLDFGKTWIIQSDRLVWAFISIWALCKLVAVWESLSRPSPKIIYLISLVIFEVASIIQAAAPFSAAFIVGRVLAGIAGSDVLTGSLTIFSAEIPKAKLPYVMGTFAWIRTIASISGPVFGGAITSSSLTWRWLAEILYRTLWRSLTMLRCFWLNPIVFVAAVVPVLLIWKGRFMPEVDDDRPPIKTALLKLDYIRMVISAATTTALLLALQFGGSTYTWSDGRTIASITTRLALFFVFVIFERFKGNDALVPNMIAWTRVVMLSSIYTSTLDGAYFILVYQICTKLSSNMYNRGPRLYQSRYPYGFNQYLGSRLAIRVTASCHFLHLVSLQPWPERHWLESFITTSRSCCLVQYCLQQAVLCWRYYILTSQRQNG